MFSYFSGTKSQATTTINDTNNSSNVSHPSVEEEITVSSMLSKSPKSSIAQPSMKDLPEEEIEYLTIKDNPYSKNEIKPTGSFGVLPMRNNSDKLQYGTGSMYVTGLASGGLYGFFRGWNKSSGSSFKLRLNSVLNTTTRFGPWLIYFYPHSIFIFRAANSIGVMSI